MLREQKEVIVNEMKDAIGRAAGVLFVDFTGLTVAEADALRGKYREADVTYRVFKNSLMARALMGTPFEEAKSYLKGTPTGVVIGFEDPVTPAKLTYEFLKECPHVKVKGGILDDQAIDVQAAEALSKLPSREELQAGVVAAAMSPGRNLAGQIKNPAGKIVGAIESLVEKLEAGGEAA